MNNLTYQQENAITVCQHEGAGFYYPRMLRLKNGEFLCAFEHVGKYGGVDAPQNKIVVARSKDGGQTWESAIDGENKMPIASILPTKKQVPTLVEGAKYRCTNAALFQLENGDVLCAYRGFADENEDKYGRYIFCSVSHDNGVTWQFHSTIYSNWDMGSEQKVKEAIEHPFYTGAYEPIFGIVEGKVTVMYADDFWPMFDNVRGEDARNHETQYLISKTLVGNEWTNTIIVQNGNQEKTVSNGITDHSRDGMPGFDVTSDGTYVMVMEGTYHRRLSNPFIVLYAHSKDGVHWSNPVEIALPSMPESKCAAPYICVTNDDRIIVSYQTDEDSVKAGTGVGDGVSTMKTIISDGTPADKITGVGNFLPSQSVFSTPPGLPTVWTGMCYDKTTNTIFCVAGGKLTADEKTDGIYLQKVVVPTL